VSNVQNGPNGPISFSFGNGLSQYNSYDPQGRLNGSWICVGAPSNGCSSQKYGFLVQWLGSQLKASSDDVVGAGMTYGYDDFNRLTSMTNSSGQQLYSFTYDRYGNRWGQNALQGGFNFNQPFSASTNRVTGTGFSYDAAGNLLSDGSNTYTYDAEGNVVQQNAAGVSSNFTYDALNQQVRTDWPAFGVAAEVVFNPSGQLASLWQPTVGLLTGKSYWGQTAIESYEPSKNMAYFAHRDWVGTRRAITDATGAVSNYRSSLPFGDGGANTFGNQDNSYDGFAGLWGGDSSLTNHATYREYWAGAGRWLQPDPYDGSYDFSNPESLNRYSYVANSPLVFNDPSGKDICTASLGASSFAGNPEIGVGACVVEGILSIFELSHLFGGPSFHGSLTPRPQSTGVPDWGNDPGSFGESLGIGRGIKTGTWGVTSALGLPDAGCEFGACGGGVGSPAVQHWKAEIENWTKQILTKAEKRPGSVDKYLLRIIGISGSGLKNILGSPIFIVDPCITNPLAPYCNKGPYNGPV
jgi:RHS repeat-associated protein